MEETIEWGLAYDCELSNCEGCKYSEVVVGPIPEHSAKMMHNLSINNHLTRLVNRRVIRYPWGEVSW